MTNDTKGPGGRAEFYEVLKVNDGARTVAKQAYDAPGGPDAGAQTGLIRSLAGATGWNARDVTGFLINLTSDERTIIDGNFVGRLAVSE
jgi:hypothetical protein